MDQERYDHVQPLLWSLHWLRVPERISFRLAVPVLVSTALHPATWRQIFSASQTSAPVGDYVSACRSTVRATIGDRAFPAAAASVWDILPETVRSPPSLPVFRSSLKTELFAQSYR